MNVFRVALFHPSTRLRFGWYDLFIYRWLFSVSIFMQLFLTKSSNGLTLKSLLFEFSVLFRESLSFTWRNVLNISYRFSTIAMATRSYRNSRDQYILYWDILTIAIVIWIPKNTSTSLAFVFIGFPLCWTLCRFVWWAICSRKLLSQNSLKYWWWAKFFSFKVAPVVNLNLVFTD